MYTYSGMILSIEVVSMSQMATNLLGGRALRLLLPYGRHVAESAEIYPGGLT